jgi:hypothetical protein
VQAAEVEGHADTVKGASLHVSSASACPGNQGMCVNVMMSPAEATPWELVSKCRKLGSARSGSGSGQRVC